jgi:hypothetical protein
VGRHPPRQGVGRGDDDEPVSAIHHEGTKDTKGTKNGLRNVLRVLRELRGFVMKRRWRCEQAVQLKRGRRPPPFICGRGQLTVSCRPSSSRPWLSSPLSFIPPFMWDSLRKRSRHHSWLPPGTLTRCRRLSLRGTLRGEPAVVLARASSIERSSFTRGGLSSPPSYQM